MVNFLFISICLSWLWHFFQTITCFGRPRRCRTRERTLPAGRRIQSIGRSRPSSSKSSQSRKLSVGWVARLLLLWKFLVCCCGSAIEYKPRGSRGRVFDCHPMSQQKCYKKFLAFSRLMGLYCNSHSKSDPRSHYWIKSFWQLNCRSSRSALKKVLRIHFLLKTDNL